jgi:hypothetical protein
LLGLRPLYIFHVLVLVVYHQFLYQVNTLESDRKELDRTHEICIAGEDPAKRRNFCPQYLSKVDRLKTLTN